MPRLLRVHFASIGHRDARLAPLTLDFRDCDGRGTDTVLWLRNGGGKSSIINLFYSVFRPNRSEFLGAAAEGKARRVEDYVKDRDLAFVVTEWDLAPAGADEPRLCVIGRGLAWKGQVRSSDASRLRKVFFSLIAAEEIGFDSLPIQGLGDPVPTFEAFRDWLRATANGHPGAQVVVEEQHGKWNEHLERLGIDPELFRYQLRMNLREGAADEAFRFGTPLDFVHFLIELAFDSRHADQLARNLEELRDQFARRPQVELERSFVVEALAALSPLIGAVRQRDRARLELASSLEALAALRGGLAERAESLARMATLDRQRAEESAEQARIAGNERDKRSRWARGLEHLALEHDVAEARARLAELDELVSNNRHEGAMLAAAIQRGELDRLEARLNELRESLRHAQAELAPERERLEQAGAALRNALMAEVQRLEQVVEDLAVRVQVARDTCERERKHIVKLRAEEASLHERLEQHRTLLRRREAARERLQATGSIEPREAVQAAIERWRQALERARALGDAASAAREEVEALLARARGQRVELTGELARVEAQRAAAKERFERGASWRQRLAGTPCISELEAVDEPDLDSPQLEARLRAEGEAAAQGVLRAGVDGAEDDRALAALDVAGLLPPSRDVERVAEVLRNRGLNVHAGPAYLAETAPAEQRLQQILADPARYAGVLVVGDTLPEDVGEVTAELEPRAPIQVTAVASIDADSCRPSERVHVVAPSPATYDYGAAERVRVHLGEQRAARERRVAQLESRRATFSSVAGDLHRFLDEFGRGQLEAARQAWDAAIEQESLLRTELGAVDRTEADLEQRIAELMQQERVAQTQATEAERAGAALATFWDEHEVRVEKTREAIEAGDQRLRAIGRELETAEQEAYPKSQKAHEELRDQQRDREGERNQLVEEAGAIVHVDTEARPAGALLEHARDSYQDRLAAWEQRTSDNRLQWEIDDVSAKARAARSRLAGLSRDLDGPAIGELAGEPDLPARLSSNEHKAELLRERRSDARADLKQAESQLAESTKRREARDLPADEPPPGTAALARALVAETRIAQQTFTETARTCEERAAAARRDADRRDRLAEQYRASVDSLESLVHGAGRELPVASPAILPDDFDKTGRIAAERRDDFTAARDQLETGEGAVRAGADAVRAIATASRFADLRSQARERMRADTDELAADCERIGSGLAPRLEVIDAHLAELDEDRRILVDALQKVGDDAGRLLQRAQRASVLPANLGPWAGKPYLRLGFQFPDTDPEQRARLEPLVDRLVARAQIPSGLELVKLAVAELAGTRGFDARVLKPDAVLRPEPIPITAMNTFSRGQQLTASILLYCTLVQLRARTRGRGTGSVDAGILVLDNPIGTCSSVPLLELQRDIAREMRVQLIYATGVDDLEALETLPNKIRLRNAMRDRASGDLHVTPEGQLEAVRIATAGG